MAVIGQSLTASGKLLVVAVLSLGFFSQTSKADYHTRTALPGESAATPNEYQALAVFIRVGGYTCDQVTDAFVQRETAYIDPTTEMGEFLQSIGADLDEELSTYRVFCGDDPEPFRVEDYFDEDGRVASRAMPWGE